MDSPTRCRRAAHAPLRFLMAGAVAAVLAVSWAPGGNAGPAVVDARERSGTLDEGVRVHRMVRYGLSQAAMMDVHLPLARRGSAPFPAVIVVHGGGWRFGDKRRMEGISRELAVHGFVAFNVNYTLAGWGRPGYPRQPAELRTAVRWVRRHAGRLGVDPARIGALGSSAGAHLAGLLAVAGHGPRSAGARVAAVVAWSGPFDLSRLRGPALAPAIETFLGCGAALCGRLAVAASPVEHVSRDDAPMLIVSSEQDLVPVDQARAMAARMAAVGVPHRLWILPGARHGTDYAATALRPSVAFLTRRLR